MVQVATNTILIDLSVRGLSPGTYHATIREKGDISVGPESTGLIWEAIKGKEESAPARGMLGTLAVGESDIGTVFWDKPIQVCEIIGRSIVIARQRDGALDRNDPDTLVGVIARSAGVWENNKTVCSCSGKTVWDERRELVDKGML